MVTETKIDMLALLTETAERHGLKIKSYQTFSGPLQPLAVIDGAKGPAFNPWTVEADLQQMGMGTSRLHWYQAPIETSLDVYLKWVSSWINK